jgi:hypothetical protein
VEVGNFSLSYRVLPHFIQNVIQNVRMNENKIFINKLYDEKIMFSEKWKQLWFVAVRTASSFFANRSYKPYKIINCSVEVDEVTRD